MLLCRLHHLSLRMASASEASGFRGTAGRRASELCIGNCTFYIHALILSVPRIRRCFFAALFHDIWQRHKSYIEATSLCLEFATARNGDPPMGETWWRQKLVSRFLSSVVKQEMLLVSVTTCFIAVKFVAIAF